MTGRGRAIGEELAEQDAYTEAVNRALCTHENVVQTSTVFAETDWERKPDGTYEPRCEGTSGITRTVDEETTGWRCGDCGKTVTLDSVDRGVVLYDDETGEPVEQGCTRDVPGVGCSCEPGEVCEEAADA